MKKQIVFIGAGNMAEALVAGILRDGIGTPESIRVTDVRAERRERFEKQFGVKSAGDNRAAVRDADIVVLAVKPQILSEVLEELKGAVSGEPLFISIAAGVSTVRIEQALGAWTRVVRVMPNMPALVGRGAAALCGGADATEEDLAVAETMLGAVGLAVRVEERWMDAVTALSGSGPAYVFYLMEAMRDAASRMGLDTDTAERLTTATVEGAARAVKDTGLDPAELRRRVTSPGGTTAAAMEILTDRKFAEAVIEAMEAARRKSEEMSGA